MGDKSCMGTCTCRPSQPQILQWLQRHHTAGGSCFPGLRLLPLLIEAVVARTDVSSAFSLCYNVELDLQTWAWGWGVFEWGLPWNAGHQHCRCFEAMLQMLNNCRPQNTAYGTWLVSMGSIRHLTRHVSGHQRCGDLTVLQCCEVGLRCSVINKALITSHVLRYQVEFLHMPRA